MKKLFLAIALLALPAAAQEEGEELFQTFCATCHGVDARGEGPMAALLTVPPTDLTGLTASHGGEFPTFQVVRRIDGRDPLLAHGGPMPVWGGFFEGDGGALREETGQPILTSSAIADLVRWLQSVQE
ncbi:c-type cytochrome [Roseitranquillus sediminis]|uniref:c-type cytochrome n=1 Tax=Roseitranquillus sediminis TaxID=2809051 RepID=UPI001D0CCDF1|nr:cytochrome c [Roseitranquillus sediminis]MBM9595753.1 cytochrome c [Roseitranquillus sediminis]